MSNPEEQWRQCDADGHGMVLFSEFAEWAIRKNFDLQEDDYCSQESPSKASNLHDLSGR